MFEILICLICILVKTESTEFFSVAEGSGQNSGLPAPNGNNNLDKKISKKY